MEEEDDAVFIIKEFLENLDSAEEEAVEASKDEVEAIEEDTEESEDELYEAGVYMTQEYQEERFMRLKEENFLLTDQLFCLHYKLEVLCRIVNIEKDNFEKEWEFFEEILFQEEEDSGKSNSKDIYLAKMYDSQREKFPLSEKKSQEDFRCLVIEDLRSAGIIELKRASEGQELKAAHDPEAFGMSENKDSDDLLLWFVEIEEEWNALIAGSSPTTQKQNWNMSNPTPILYKHPLTTQSLTDIDRDATQDIWQQNEFIHDTPQEILGGSMFGESDSLFGKHGVLFDEEIQISTQPEDAAHSHKGNSLYTVARSYEKGLPEPIENEFPQSLIDTHTLVSHPQIPYVCPSSPQNISRMSADVSGGTIPTVFGTQEFVKSCDQVEDPYDDSEDILLPSFVGTKELCLNNKIVNQYAILLALLLVDVVLNIVGLLLLDRAKYMVLLVEKSTARALATLFGCKVGRGTSVSLKQEYGMVSEDTPGPV